MDKAVEEYERRATRDPGVLRMEVERLYHRLIESIIADPKFVETVLAYAREARK